MTLWGCYYFGEQGSGEFLSVLNGYTFLFLNAENRDMFGAPKCVEKRVRLCVCLFSPDPT